MSVKLSRKNLAEIPEQVVRPRYDVSDLEAGIVHFGVGNFHRAHQARYLDRLFDKGLAHDWSIVGAGVMPGEVRTRQTLQEQDWLSLHVAQSAETSDAHIIGSMIEFLPIGDGKAIVAQLVNPTIRIVSLTVTEGGYFLDAEGCFSPDHPAIAADIASPRDPSTVFGLMIEALRQRREAGIAPFTIMSCDNLPHNGNLTRNTVTGLAKLMDPDLGEWIAQNVAFPNGMVDRITPATTDRERRIAREEFGVADELPVFSEDFRQWVLEDNFPQGRPPLEKVGVTFVDDVTPYEEMKLRILNASHAMIAYPAALMGIEFAHEAIVHPLIGKVLDTIQTQEVIPGVTPVPEMSPHQYFDVIRRRFANPKIADTIARLCHDGSNRQPKFIVPAIRHALAHGLPIDGLALSSALWCHYCAGTRDDGSKIPANDPEWDRLNPLAVAAKTDPDLWLAQEGVYGRVGRDERFRQAFAGHIAALSHKSTNQVFRNFLANEVAGRSC